MAETKRETEVNKEKEEWNLSREKILAILCAKQEVETNGLAFITQSITRRIESRFI